MNARLCVHLLCLLLIAGVAIAGESPDGPAPKETSPSPLAKTEDQLPPIAPITDCSEYLKLTPKLTKEEFQQFLARAEKGEPLAMDLVFFSWLNGFGTPADFNQARAWLSRGNQAGAPLCRLYHGRNQLGYWLDLSRIDNKNGKQHLRQAVAFFRKPAQKGNAAAQFFVAVALEMLGDPTATDWYKNSATQEFSIAQLNLGISLCAGQGIPKDVDAGMRLLRKAADQGLPFAMVEMSDCCKRPETANPDESLRWLRRAVDCGHPIAQHKMGWTYADGSQVTKNQQEAQKFFLLSAEAGHPLGMLVLARRYRGGDGGTVNDDEARKWFRRASVIGYKTGAYFHAMEQAKRLLEQGKPREARDAAGEALRSAEYELAPNTPSYALLLHHVGHVFLDLGDLTKAKELHGRAIEVYRHTKDDRNLAEILMCGSQIDAVNGNSASTEAQLRACKRLT